MYDIYAVGLKNEVIFYTMSFSVLVNFHIVRWNELFPYYKINCNKD